MLNRPQSVGRDGLFETEMKFQLAGALTDQSNDCNKQTNIPKLFGKHKQWFWGFHQHFNTISTRKL